MDRRAIYIEGFNHTNPIPAACRIGPMLMSGVITGRNPLTGALPPTVDEQCVQMFRHVVRILEAAGGSTDNLLKMTVWLRDPTNRVTLNAEWLRLFPDPSKRPARHALPMVGDGDSLIQCDITAFFDE
jgi:2-iminobutanoate/2-iminopropanoate deaminase